MAINPSTANTEEPLPPLDFRGLPSVDAYGNKVDLPKTDGGTGLPPMADPWFDPGQNQGSSSPTQTNAPSKTAATPPSPGVPTGPVKGVATPPSSGVPANPVPSGATTAPAAKTAPVAVTTAAMGASASPVPGGATPGETPTPAPKGKTQQEFDNERARQEEEGRRYREGKAGGAAFKSAFNDAVKSGMPEWKARQVAAEAAKEATKRFRQEQNPFWVALNTPAQTPSAAPAVPGGATSPSPGVPANPVPGGATPPSPTVNNNGQPGAGSSGTANYDAYGNQVSFDSNGNVVPTQSNTQPSPGAIGNPNIVATPNGPMFRGTDGATMPVFQDPVTGYTLPSSSELSPEEFSRNLDTNTRSQALTVFSDGNDPTAQKLQKIRMDLHKVTIDTNLSDREKQQAWAALVKQEDMLLWSAMRDPSRFVSARGRQRSETDAQTERENRQSAAIQERIAKQREQQNARMYQDAYKRAKKELENDPFRTVSEDEIRQRAQQLYMQQAAQTGAMAPGSQPATSAQPAPTQSGAPDSSSQSIAIEPGSPIDFQQAPNGALVALVPNPDDPARPIRIRAGNFNGRAVAVPRNQAELDLLPPGSLYILEGAARRGEMKDPKRKEGEVPGLQGVSAESPEAQDFAIREDAAKLGEPRTKAQAAYQPQKAEYDNMMQEAKNRAAQQLGVVLGKNGEPSFEAVGGGERTGRGARSSEVDPKGQWADAVQKQMIAVAEERYGAGGKTPPEWIRRRGDEIIAVDAPTAPKYGENAEAQEMATARENYFAKRGTTEFKVRNERMLNEAKSSYTVALRDGKPTVRVGNRLYPGVRIREGNMQAVLPTVESGKNPPQEVANAALTLLTSGKPFAIDIGGRMVPFKLDRNDPRLKIMMENPNKTLSLTNGQIGDNPGVQAARSYVDDVFGYLPVSVRKHILDRMLTNPRLGGYTLTAD